MRIFRCTTWVYKRQRNQRPNCQHTLDHRESKGIPEKHLLCFNDHTKVFDYMDHNKLWKTLKELGMPNHLTCLLRNLYAGQEATIRTLYGTTDWFQIEKGIIYQGCILPPCLFNFYAENIMRNARLESSYKLESRLPGETATSSDMQTIPL